MKTLRNIIVTGLFVSIPAVSFGQTGVESMGAFELLVGLGLILIISILIVLIFILKSVDAVLQRRLVEKGMATAPIEADGTVWSRFWDRINNRVPISQEQTVVTDHEYDGIRELDNQLPSWWIYGFYFTILFGVVYLIRFHVIGSGPTQHEEYVASMRQAEAEVQAYLMNNAEESFDENTVTLTEDPNDLAEGKLIYDRSCSVCHAADGGGGIGPNFTDKYWIHGGDIKSIFSTVKYGVPAKGMVSWESQLSAKKMQQVSSYIYMFEGKESASPKAPEGDLFERATIEDNSETETETGAGTETEIEQDTNTSEEEATDESDS